MRPLMLTLALAGAACTSEPPAPGDVPEPQPDGAVGDPCVTTAGCRDGLACSFGYCRAATRDGAIVDTGDVGDSTAALDAAADVVDAEGGQDSGPLAACTVKDVTRSGTTFAYSPSPLVAGPVTVTVTDQLTAFSNVSLALCTPSGLVNDASVTVVSSVPPYKWKFGAVTLPSGSTQVRFMADPNKSVFGTQRITIP